MFLQDNTVCNHSILNRYEKDDIIRKSLISFLEYTTRAITSNITFDKLLQNSFVNYDKEVLVKEFLNYKEPINDLLWLKAGNYTIDNREYITYSNVSAEYLKLILMNFIEENRSSLINEFIVKFCIENEIRDGIINKALLTEDKSNVIIGNLLGDAYRSELDIRNKEKEDAELLFTTRSKETYEHLLPELCEKDQAYVAQIDSGCGFVNIKNNIFEYEPLTTFKEESIYVTLLLVDKNTNRILNRKVYKIRVLPQKYFAPSFVTYRVKPGHSVDIQLQDVTDDYSYVASVLENQGNVNINDKFVLKYTAPNTLYSQNIAIGLKLLYMRKREVYNTIINVNIVVTEEDISSSETFDNFEKIDTKIAIISNEINKVNLEINTISDKLDNANLLRKD